MIGDFFVRANATTSFIHDCTARQILQGYVRSTSTLGPR